MSVVLGFAWSGQEDCRRHNDYLLDQAAKSGGRLIPFCTVQPRAGRAAADEIERCARGGARGIGELRPQDQCYSILDADEESLLASAARDLGLVLLFHVSEPVGHVYPGKAGLPLGDFTAFATRHPDLKIVGAHWAGGLPLYAHMPEVRSLLSGLYCDTAATSLLYSASVFTAVAAATGAGRVLFGSDFPLVAQRRAVRDVRTSGLDTDAIESVLGGNARRLLGLT